MQVPIISAYQPNPSLPTGVIDGIVHFFVEARDLAPSLTDGSSAPAYNLRSLARAMQYVAHAAPLHGLQRALFDGFGMTFAGMLDSEGAALISSLVQKHILSGRAPPGLPRISKTGVTTIDHRDDRCVNVEVGLHTETMNSIYSSYAGFRETANLVRHVFVTMFALWCGVGTFWYDRFTQAPGQQTTSN